MTLRRTIPGLLVAMLIGSVLLPAVAETYEFTGEGWEKAPEPKEGTAAGELAMVRDYLERGKERKAVKAAEKLLKRYPDAPQREEAYYLAARAEMQRGRLYKGYEWLEKQLAAYPAGDLSDEALRREYEIAEEYFSGRKRVVAAIFRLPATSEAIEIMTRIAEHAPGSELARRAMMRIADYHYDQGEWAEAVDAYDHYLELFGKTPQAQYATGQAARARYNAFRSVDYDMTPLLDAEQRFEAFRTAYPEAAAEAGVDETLAQITDTKAKNAYRTGWFYERTYRREPARFYYRQVVEDYPDTTWAGQAREGLARVGGSADFEPAAEADNQEGDG